MGKHIHRHLVLLLLACPLSPLAFPAVSLALDTTPPDVGCSFVFKEGRGELLGPDGYGYEWGGPITYEPLPHDWESMPCAMRWAVDDGPWTDYTAPFTVRQFGIHVVHVEATDAVGNVALVDFNAPDLFGGDDFLFAVDNVGAKTYAQTATVRRFRRARLRYRVVDKGSVEDRITIKIKNRKGRTLEKYTVGDKAINKSYVYRPRIFLRRGTYKWFVYAKDYTGNKQRLVGRNSLFVR